MSQEKVTKPIDVNLLEWYPYFFTYLCILFFYVHEMNRVGAISKLRGRHIITNLFKL